MEVSGPGQQTGTWVGAGAINDAGTAIAILERPDERGNATARHTLTGREGTLTLDERVRLRPFPPPTPHRLMVEGTWELFAATGRFANLTNAQGRVDATVDREKVPPEPPEITFVRVGTAE
jgi:hypothetical protein